MSSAIEISRVGDPWLTGRHVDRIVPVYVFHTFLAASFQTARKLSSLKDAVVDPNKALTAGLSEVVKLPPGDERLFGELVAGLLSPDRRVFRDRKLGGASKEGSLFPAVAGLVKRASDDGLGSSMRALFESLQGDWRQRLTEMLAPANISDPATQFVVHLLGNDWCGSAGTTAGSTPPLSTSDEKLVGFVDRLIRGNADGSRLSALRELSLGLHLTAIVRMVRGPIDIVGKDSNTVFVFAGLPPGDQRDPRVLAASQSYQSWLSRSWKNTHAEFVRKLAEEPDDKASSVGESRRSRLTRIVARRMLEKAPVMVAPLEKVWGDSPADEAEWVRNLLEGPLVGLTKSELMRRVRSLGGNIGLAGPDRGVGRPRLFFDTPLLSVLAKGIVGTGRMDFDEFVTALADVFGFVLGPGAKPEVLDGLDLSGSNGADPYEIAMANQELLRERLLCVGLARAYSDSHTEVIVNV